MKINLKPILLNTDWKKKKTFWILIGCLVIAIGFHIASSRLISGLLSQQAAQRWDSAGGSRQVSVFFSDGLSVSTDTIQAFEHQLSDTLEQDSITAPNENARLWADAYSAKGTVTLGSNQSSISVEAYGIGGDYFLFHPLVLKDGGSYLTSSDAMQDRVLLDEASAWRLFGSYDVAGQEIAIGSGANLHVGIVAGVIESEDGYLNEKAGASAMTVYLSYDMLRTYGYCETIQSYEIVMPNPIDNFAVSTVTELLGMDEAQIEVIENSSRFHYINRLKTLLEFGTRSMNTKSIIYPYWENTARGCEDILAVFTLLETISWIVILIFLLAAFIRWYRKHPVSLRKIGGWISHQADARREAKWEQAFLVQAGEKSAGQIPGKRKNRFGKMLRSRHKTADIKQRTGNE